MTCDHGAWTGDEGPVALLGRMPTRWRCDGCGAVAEERPVCLGCARDTYPDQPLSMSFPSEPRTCHVCGMTTEMGYALPLTACVTTQEKADFEMDTEVITLADGQRVLSVNGQGHFPLPPEKDEVPDA